ncbi:MAG: hypothetical protein R6T89_05540 [Candidatus Syntrophosphaera sp.]
MRKLVNVFNRREVILYHSCQMREFDTYLKLGGIPSRNLIEESGFELTPFQSDQNDKKNQVWDKVFVNLIDFGRIFAGGNTGVPTVYGPILFKIGPDALFEAEDVAICLRSAGVEGFDREEEAIKTIQDIEKLFTNSTNDEPKSREQLKESFDMDYVSHPEISCTYSDELLHMEFVSKIIVDPYDLDGERFVKIVEKSLSEKSPVPEIFVEGRDLVTRKRRSMYNTLVDILAKSDSVPGYAVLMNDPEVSTDIKEWLEDIKDKNLLKQWSRYAGYFQNGTLGYLDVKGSRKPSKAVIDLESIF